jgi:hypothetical protein
MLVDRLSLFGNFRYIENKDDDNSPVTLLSPTSQHATYHERNRTLGNDMNKVTTNHSSCVSIPQCFIVPDDDVRSFIPPPMVDSSKDVYLDEWLNRLSTPSHVVLPLTNIRGGRSTSDFLPPIGRRPDGNVPSSSFTVLPTTKHL